MEEKIADIVKQMTLEEKAGLCSGEDFWKLKSVERLGLGQIMVTDGPHGLRKQSGNSDHVGLNKSVPATCFPTAAATACSWDVNLMREMGQALGDECLQESVAVILGPGANIKRSPLCGRNFEYISEDPYLSGNMAAALIEGVQSKGIGTSLKHFAMNNQEERRMTIDVVADERAQREIYLAGFEIAVKKAQPWTVMCSYNKVGGTYLSDNKRLLKDVLKTQWEHKGLVVTDWGACNDRVEGIKAGLALEMPSSGGKNDEKIVQAVKNGTLPEELLDEIAGEITQLILKSQDAAKTDYKYDKEEHHVLAKKMAQNSAVLLKNDGILPLKKDVKIAIVGEFAKRPRYQGAGSSIINPHKVDNMLDVLDDMKISYSYAQGYSVKSEKADAQLIKEAVDLAGKSDVAVIFAGLTDDYESEGYDRKHINLPESHNELILRVAKANPNTVIVLHNGAPVAMPWLNDVSAVLEMYLHGQAGAGAAADILFGDINPSGKLAETFPISLEDNSSYKYFPGNTLTVEYRESIFVGYRYYDKAGKEVMFAFGHGLSYTEFEYSNLKIKKIDETEYDVSANIKNIGKVAGSEIVQLYVKNNESDIFKPEKELRAFDKLTLLPGEEKQVRFSLNKRSFCYYNVNIADWHTDSGRYAIQLGSSSRDIRLEKEVTVKIEDNVMVPNYRDTAPYYYNFSNDIFDVPQQQFEAVYGTYMPISERMKGGEFDQSCSLLDVKEKMLGRLLYKAVMWQTKKMFEGGELDIEEGNLAMMKAMVEEMPLRALGMMGGDMLPKYFTEGVVLALNGKIIKGLLMLLKK